MPQLSTFRAFIVKSLLVLSRPILNLSCPSISHHYTTNPVLSLIMSSPQVIVFGPTGAVGSSAAITASSLGSSVTLAMRDTSKAIPGLSPDAEKSGQFTRITADLHKSETVSAAVTQSNATHAFIYLAHGSPDHMRSTIQALKDSGIKLVVFLSSFTIPAPGNYEDLKTIPQEDAIPWIHAQVEIVLHEIFGREGFVALRPGAFASNIWPNVPQIRSGTVKVWNPSVNSDCIVPADIGRVGGTVLAKGVPGDGNRSIYVFGPKLYNQKQIALEMIRAMGKKEGEVKVVQATEEEAKERFGLRHGQIPSAVVQYMLRAGAEAEKYTPPEGKLAVLAIPMEPEWLGNVQKYSGRKATTLQEWLEMNKEKLQ